MKKKSNATQDFVPIKEVRDGVVILEDGSLRSVILASSINFSLKSPEEQGAVLMQFQNFLNTIDFSIEIVIQSRRLDIKPYLNILEEQKKSQMNELMRIQTEEYIAFVRKFTENTNIMSKNFFVIVPYTPAIIRKGDTLGERIKSGLGIGSKDKKSKNEAKRRRFEEHLSQLEQRISVVEQGLRRSGVRVARLGTEEVIELLYQTFNPGETGVPGGEEDEQQTT